MRAEVGSPKVKKGTGRGVMRINYNHTCMKMPVIPILCVLSKELIKKELVV